MLLYALVFSQSNCIVTIFFLNESFKLVNVILPRLFTLVNLSEFFIIFTLPFTLVFLSFWTLVRLSGLNFSNNKYINKSYNAENTVSSSLT